MAAKTVRLVDLPGRSRGDVFATDVSSRSGAIRALRAGAVAVTTADDYGAITIHRDDDGLFRCEFMRHRITFDATSFSCLKDVAEWLRTWWPKLRSI